MFLFAWDFNQFYNLSSWNILLLPNQTFKVWSSLAKLQPCLFMHYQFRLKYLGGAWYIVTGLILPLVKKLISWFLAYEFNCVFNNWSKKINSWSSCTYWIITLYILKEKYLIEKRIFVHVGQESYIKKMQCMIRLKISYSCLHYIKLLANKV